ncbi:MAG: hypothetical protein WAV20_14640 [Blastocatellia bacterium]
MYSNQIGDTDWVRLLRWLARGMSVVSIALLVLFLFGEGLNPAAVNNREWIGLMFFPVGVIVGFAIAWKREALGSLLSIGSLVGFYVVYGLILSRRLPEGWAFIAFTTPAFLFLLSWFMRRTMTRDNVSS